MSAKGRNSANYIRGQMARARGRGSEDRLQKGCPKAIAVGIGKRTRAKSNEKAEAAAVEAGTVIPTRTIRRDSTPAPTLDQPQDPKPEPQDSEKMKRAQACSDAKREVMRSIAIRSPHDEHPQFPGRHRNWSPNRRQRRNLEKQGLL